MHSVDAEIVNISDNQDIPLSRVNKLTITNNGTADVEFGFKDSYATLKTGQSTGFESGANSWFGEDVHLKLRFNNATNESKECTLMICRVIKPSNAFNDALR